MAIDPVQLKLLLKEGEGLTVEFKEPFFDTEGILERQGSDKGGQWKILL